MKATAYLTIASALVFTMTSCSVQKTEIISKKDTAIAIKADSIRPNAAVDSIIMPYRKSLELEMNQVLVESEAPIEKGQPESTLGNLVSDICLKRASIAADFAILNNGGLRVSLPKGNITKGRVFELMPFDNEVVVVTISGEKMKELLNYIGSNNGVPVSGLSGTIINGELKDVKIGGNPFDVTRNYRVCTTDYLANNGDKMTFFSNPIQVEKSHYRLRDALIDEFTERGKRGEKLNPKIEGRIK